MFKSNFMKNSILSISINLFFGLLFSFIGFVNTFWGNDPFFGLVITLLSLIFYLPILNYIIEKIPKKVQLIIKIILGILIVWASLGVGELFEKIELMNEYFPLPSYESFQDN